MIDMNSIFTFTEIFSFIWALSSKIYGYVTTISFPKSPAYNKLKNTTFADDNSVHTINADIQLMYEVPPTVKIYRAECSLYDAEKHFFTNNSS
jgi:hypothetical protein